MSSSTPDSAAAGKLDAAAADALAIAEAAVAAGDTRALSDETIQRLITAGIRLFAHKVEQEGRHFSPLTGPDAVTPTDAAVTVTELLRTVNLNLFDLSMWAGRRETMDEPSGR